MELLTMDAIIQLLLQAPLVGLFIYYELQRSKQHASERQERDVQWRDFLTEMLHSLEEALRELRTDIASVDRRLDTLTPEIKAANIKFTQLELQVSMQLDALRQEWQAHNARETRREERAEHRE
jgi:hypothetical protein